jgi:hypothetical protein
LIENNDVYSWRLRDVLYRPETEETILGGSFSHPKFGNVDSLALVSNLHNVMRGIASGRSIINAPVTKLKMGEIGLDRVYIFGENMFLKYGPPKKLGYGKTIEVVTPWSNISGYNFKCVTIDGTELYPRVEEVDAHTLHLIFDTYVTSQPVKIMLQG